ncbi:hypothetical protein D3C72_1906490 [compost metagenome]
MFVQLREEQAFVARIAAAGDRTEYRDRIGTGAGNGFGHGLFGQALGGTIVVHSHDGELLRDGETGQDAAQQELCRVQHRGIAGEFAQMLGAGRGVGDDGEAAGIGEGRQFALEVAAH